MSSNIPPPTDHEWVQFYQMDLSSASAAGQGAPRRPLPPLLVQGSSDVPSPNDGTYGTTSGSGFVPGGSSSTACQSSPGAAAGRVSKPARKRRASRCAPVTLLNTDPTNFRAMVQQFTGVPSAPFSFADGAQTNVPNLSFGLSSTSTSLNYPQSNPTIQPYQYHQHQQQQQQQQQIFSVMNNNNNSSSNTGDDHHALHYPMLFNNSTPNLLEVSSSSAATPSGAAGDGFLMESISRRMSSSNDHKR